MNARGIDRHRLLAKDVLAGGDGRLQMHWPKMGRGGQQHHVDVGRQQFLIGVESDEFLIVRHGDLVGEVGPQLLQALLDLVGKRVGQRRQLDVRIGSQGVAGGARAPPAAADQTDFQRVVSGRMNATRDAERAGQRAAGDDQTRLLEKLATRAQVSAPGGMSNRP